MWMWEVGISVINLAAEENNNDQRDDAPAILVVGGDGAIGSHLFHEAHARGLTVHRTSRRDPAPGGAWSLQLGEDSSTSSLLKIVQVRGVTDAVISIGETSMAACASEPNATWKINVTDTQQLIEALVGSGVSVVLISSGAVFSGRSQRPTEESACDPETEYGRQKAALEDSVLAYEGTRIVRFSKVLSSSNGLWSQWMQDIRAGKTIRAFENMTLAPLRTSVAVSAILRQLQIPSGRIVHVSPPDEITYTEAVRLLAHEMGRPVNLEPLKVHLDVNRGILPNRWTALGTVHRDAFLQTESSQSAMQMFTHELLV